ncbi:serine phosphatase RsbU (regulator of sigma subunit) [Streptomyces olivoverticillatus]|uniref:Serine phosphatase RsbU (Regulator of sigma subunit) n=1 Tax=Streptomyces olivoverticillatus TaxID=66427 RepID=A0A7W7LPZ7_9ACTN|nr:PP2C family protein-serine/threonine phosphatase [Streptomyces olivoverticillatus]MBB4893626.1 serine phosphatase RsbU (regulator of sigma subunit) [Streptomyces olivoverticillatus]
MPSPLPADRSAAEPPESGPVDALISQTQRLRGGIDAVRRETAADAERSGDPQLRWQRALCELAAHHAENLGEHLGQLRQGLPAAELAAAGAAGAATLTAPRLPEQAVGQAPPAAPASGRVGSAEWNFLTDEVTWSEELFELFGRRPEDGALTLDELPSCLLEEDRELLTALVTDCLVDGKPIDGEFRIVSGGGSLRTVHMMGEPVLDADGCTASMWAVLRDVSELRRSQQAVHETRDSAQRRRQIAQTEHRLAVELQEAVLPPWRGSLRFPHEEKAARGVPDPRDAVGALDLAAHYLPSATSSLVGGDWFDAMRLPGGQTLLTVGGLTGHGVTATSTMAMLLGAVRGMAVSGAEPGPLMGWLNHLLDASVQPALGSAVCCRYDPATRTMVWAQAGHPAPLLFRDGTGQRLLPPEGVLLGAVSDAAYAQAEEALRPGDVLLLHTDGLTARPDTGRLLELAPRFAAAKNAQECVRAVLEECGGRERKDDACVLIACIGS